jgi:hypothetical protein
MGSSQNKRFGDESSSTKVPPVSNPKCFIRDKSEPQTAHPGPVVGLVYDAANDLELILVQATLLPY